MSESRIVRIMQVTGFRFSYGYRRGATCFHRWVYSKLDTVRLNLLAEGVELGPVWLD